VGYEMMFHLATLIFVVTLCKQFVDRKCQQEYKRGVSDCKEDFKKEVAMSIRSSFRAGIEKGKEDYLREYVIESKEGLRKHWDFNETSIANAINKYEER
jgi:hypothetical protein